MSYQIAENITTKLTVPILDKPKTVQKFERLLEKGNFTNPSSLHFEKNLQQGQRHTIGSSTEIRENSKVKDLTRKTVRKVDELQADK